MQLNIKDPETVRLARDPAGRSGKSVTETIRAALERENAENEAGVAARITLIDSIVARAIG